MHSRGAAAFVGIQLSRPLPLINEIEGNVRGREEGEGLIHHRRSERTARGSALAFSRRDDDGNFELIANSLRSRRPVTRG